MFGVTITLWSGSYLLVGQSLESCGSNNNYLVFYSNYESFHSKNIILSESGYLPMRPEKKNKFYKKNHPNLSTYNLHWLI